MTKESGRAFRELFEQKGYSRNKLANESGVDLSTISRLASGKLHSTGLENLNKIARCLQVTVDELSGVFTNPKIYTFKRRSRFNEFLVAWADNADLLYSAPACAFISGEHSVVFGHPAVYLPLPLRLYIKLEPSHQIEGIFIDDFKCPDPKEEINILNTELIQAYGSCSIEYHKQALTSLFLSIIKPFLKSEFDGIGFRVNVLSSFPVAVGLNSSGAFSACIAKALFYEFMDIEKFKVYFELVDQDNQEVAMLLAWAIENCFHGGCSSGAGATVSFNGRLGRHPILYSISKRSYLSHKHLDGWSSVSISQSEQGFRLLSKIKRFVFDPGECLEGLPDYPEPPLYNVSILYSGVPSRTEAVLKRDVRSYVKESTERVAHVCNMFDKTFKVGEIQRSLAVHRYEIIEEIYLNTQFDGDKSEQMSRAYFEMLSESLGNISISTFNSIVSDWSSVPSFMNSYQALLCGIGLSHPAIESLINQLKFVSMEEQLCEDPLTSYLGIKITGAGKGGDIITLSLLNKSKHQDLFQKITKDGFSMHFSSCELSDSEWNSPVQGVRKEHIL